MVKKLIQKSFFHVLKYGDFKKIWVSQIFSQIALNMLTYALVLHIYELTKSSTSISLVMIASAIPVAIFGPFSGVIADRIDYRKVLIYTNILRFIIGLFLIVSMKNVLGMLEIIFIISALSQFFTPAESSSIPLVVPKKDLVAANSVVMVTTYVTLLVGYAIAGPILGAAGSISLFLLCGLLFLAASEVTRRLSNYDAGKVYKKFSIFTMASDISEVWQEMKEGIKYLRHSKKILQPMIKLTIGWVVLGAIITLLPAYGETIMHINPKYIGPIIIAPTGIGMMISALTLSRYRVGQGKILNNGFFVTAIGFLLFATYYFYRGVPLSFSFALLMMVIVGFGCSMIQVPAQTLLHIHSEQDKRGRVFGISSMQLRLAQTLPSFVFGGIADLTSPLITMLLIALAFFIYALVLVFEE